MKPPAISATTRIDTTHQKARVLISKMMAKAAKMGTTPPAAIAAHLAIRAGADVNAKSSNPER